MTLPAKLRPDDDTTLGMLMSAVKRLTDQQTSTDVKVGRVLDKLERIDRRLDSYDDRLGRLESDDYDEITGVESMHDLEKAARTHRAKAALEELQRKRLQRWGAMAAPFVLGLGAALWQLIQGVLGK